MTEENGKKSGGGGPPVLLPWICMLGDLAAADVAARAGANALASFAIGAAGVVVVVMIVLVILHLTGLDERWDHCFARLMRKRSIEPRA